MKFGLQLSLLVASELASFAAGCQPSNRDVIDVGEIVGAQYLAEDNRFFLFVTCEGPLTPLRPDYLVQMGRTALEVGDFGFSLDFGRKGDAPIRELDLLSAGQIAGTLLTNDHPLARMLRSAFDRDDDLRALQKDDTHDSTVKLRRSLARFLNRARNFQQVRELITIDELSPYVAALSKLPRRTSRRVDQRYGRLVLEDFFTGALRKDITERYEIAYKPSSKNPLLQKILSGTATEAALLAADVWLKRFSGGDGIPAGLVYGPSELNLCTADAQSVAEAGEKDATGEYVNFFNLQLDYETADLPGIALWLRNPRIVVQSDSGSGEGPAPACATRFSASLTRHVPDFMVYTGQFGADMRALRLLLMLNRAMAFMASVVPVDPQHLRSIPVEKLSNTPPKVVSVPVYFAANGKPEGFAVSGGVQLGGSQSAMAFPLQQNGDGGNPITADPASTNQASIVTIDGRDLLRIDISSILGLGAMR